MASRKNKITKISSIILLFVSLFFGVKYYKTSNNFKSYVKNSELENKVLESQLTEILHKYDSVSLKDKTIGIRTNDKVTIDEVLLKSSLNSNARKDSTLLYINSRSKLKKSVSEIKRGTKSKLTNKSAQFNVLNINVKGVKIYSDNYNVRDAKIQQLRVCFTLEENHFIKAEEKTIYVQVVNSKNQIISAGNTFVESDGNVKLQYSAALIANYLNEDTDVCTYVNLEQKKTIKGKYKVNIYHDFVKIGTTIFEY